MVKVADRSLLLCAPLCFLINKCGIVSYNILTSIVSDFYSGELIADVKNRLLEDLSSNNLTVQLPRIPKCRDSANRLNSAIDDIFNLLTFADKNKLLSISCLDLLLPTLILFLECGYLKEI
jgi:hypothetical protein